MLLVAIVFISYISVQSFWAGIHYRQVKELAKNVKNWKGAATEYEKPISISPTNAEYEEVLRIKPGHTKAKQAVKRVKERIQEEK